MRETLAGRVPFEPVLQRYRDYARQRQMTLSDLLLENRIVFLGSSPETGGQAAITDYLANITIQKLLFLQYENKNQEINMYINCPGGSVTATLAIYDTMQFLECPIQTYCMGLAASGAAIILAAGGKGRRFALPHSKIMIHQPYGQVGGQVSDIDIQAQEILKDRTRINEILAQHTGQPIDRIERETDRDKYYSPKEALEFGLVDEVLTKLPGEAKKT
jgi:ATP-dependent Clp protease protease subunit